MKTNHYNPLNTDVPWREIDICGSPINSSNLLCDFNFAEDGIALKIGRSTRKQKKTVS
jgi:hypothetical protein